MGPFGFPKFYFGVGLDQLLVVLLTLSVVHKLRLRVFSFSHIINYIFPRTRQLCEKLVAQHLKSIQVLLLKMPTVTFLSDVTFVLTAIYQFVRTEGAFFLGSFFGFLIEHGF